MDPLRADVFLDLLAGKVGEAPAGGVVDIRVDLDTLAAPTDQRRAVKASDVTCVCPGCRMPATQ